MIIFSLSSGARTDLAPINSQTVIFAAEGGPWTRGDNGGNPAPAPAASQEQTKQVDALSLIHI